jgi:hypothetical protein
MYEPQSGSGEEEKVKIKLLKLVSMALFAYLSTREFYVYA